MQRIGEPMCPGCNTELPKGWAFGEQASLYEGVPWHRLCAREKIQKLTEFHKLPPIEVEATAGRPFLYMRVSECPAELSFSGRKLDARNVPLTRDEALRLAQQLMTAALTLAKYP